MPKTVLVVEDYADVRTMMKILIKRQGYQVVEAADGYEAIEAGFDNVIIKPFHFENLESFLNQYLAEP